METFNNTTNEKRKIYHYTMVFYHKRIEKKPLTCYYFNDPFNCDIHTQLGYSSKA